MHLCLPLGAPFHFCSKTKVFTNTREKKKNPERSRKMNRDEEARFCVLFCLLAKLESSFPSCLLAHKVEVTLGHKELNRVWLQNKTSSPLGEASVSDLLLNRNLYPS